MKTISVVYDDFQGHVDYTRHACRGIVVRNGKILLCYHRKNGVYLIPGGGVEQDESYSECLVREMREETGYEISANEPYLEIKEYFYWEKNWEHIQHYFVCNVEENLKTVHLTEAEKEAGATTEWVDIEKAVAIFSEYTDYENIDKAKYGLYKRELTAINEYLTCKKK